MEERVVLFPWSLHQKVELPGGLIEYVTVIFHEQHQNYNGGFSAEFDEYTTLHAGIETTTRRFTESDARGQCHFPEEYLIVHEAL